VLQQQVNRYREAVESQQGLEEALRREREEGVIQSRKAREAEVELRKIPLLQQSLQEARSRQVLSTFY